MCMYVIYIYIFVIICVCFLKETYSKYMQSGESGELNHFFSEVSSLRKANKKTNRRWKHPCRKEIYVFYMVSFFGGGRWAFKWPSLLKPIQWIQFLEDRVVQRLAVLFFSCRFVGAQSCEGARRAVSAR